MIRLLRLLFLLAIGFVLLVVAFANRGLVTVTLLPGDMGLFLNWNPTVELPLFLVIFGGILAGLAIGFVWEWARESKHRSAASRHRRQAQTLEREVSRLREKEPAHKDEVLALLEGKTPAR
ncbi:MAG: lipopolysaccharide assembly protein LapA domain-containing protein [Pseudomonadota bacterium]